MPLRDPDERRLAAARSADAGPGDDADDLAIRRLGAVARSLTEDDFAVGGPPPGLWSRIADAVDADASGAPEAGATAPEGDAATTAPEGGRQASSAGEIDRRRAAGASRARAGRAWRPEGRGPWLVAAAAVVVLVVGVAVALVAGGDGGRAGEVVATAVLEPLEPEAAPAAGPAELVESDDGTTLDLAIDAGALPDDGGYYEVWLIDTAVEGMVSLGPVRADGTYDVPAGVDPGRFPIVDVSAEPTDGDPTHSGTSVLRGTLA